MMFKRKPVPRPAPLVLDAEQQAAADYLAATDPSVPGWQEAQRAMAGEWTPEDRAKFVPGPEPREPESKPATVCSRHRYDRKAGVLVAISRRYAYSPCNGDTHMNQGPWWW